MRYLINILNNTFRLNNTYVPTRCKPTEFNLQIQTEVKPTRQDDRIRLLF